MNVQVIRYLVRTLKARGRRSKPLGVACAAWLERLARRFRQPRCVHTDYAIPICYSFKPWASKPLSVKLLLKAIPLQRGIDSKQFAQNKGVVRYGICPVR